MARPVISNTKSKEEAIEETALLFFNSRHHHDHPEGFSSRGPHGKGSSLTDVFPIERGSQVKAGFSKAFWFPEHGKRVLRGMREGWEDLRNKESK
jgi:hypothetical protein